MTGSDPKGKLTSGIKAAEMLAKGNSHALEICRRGHGCRRRSERFGANVVQADASWDVRARPGLAGK
jgi:hypothetical protein